VAGFGYPSAISAINDQNGIQLFRITSQRFFRTLEMAVAAQNFIYEEVESRLNLRDAYVQKILLWRSKKKN
jgi:hypothetical protein